MKRTLSLKFRCSPLTLKILYSQLVEFIMLQGLRLKAWSECECDVAWAIPASQEARPGQLTSAQVQSAPGGLIIS